MRAKAKGLAALVIGVGVLGGALAVAAWHRQRDEASPRRPAAPERVAMTQEAPPVIREVASLKDEPVLAERSRMYRTICEKRLTPTAAPGSTPDELYYRAIVESNSGNPTSAIQLLDQALQQTPNASKLLYARASAWALSANADAAVNDLRQAIAIDPTIRFHAVNDPDFDGVRDEAAFIDIVEPTPTEA